MTPQQHARAKEIFLAACEQPVEQRAGFLDQACGSDALLRGHVDELLVHHSTAGVCSGADQSAPPAEPGSPGYEPGARIGERYRIVSLLGKGGMGEVYRADDLVLGQTVALKFLPAEYQRNSAALERLVREARLARAVTHPHVCRVHDLVVDSATGSVFISMEYVDGEDLRSLLRRIGRLPEERAIEITRQLCLALAAAHAKGILHRDLKPANIMLDRAGQVRVTDFGLAALQTAVEQREIRSGTPAYMAPELFAGTGVSVRSDIYALGLVLYELVTGRPAFEADSFSGLAVLHQRTRPLPPRELVLTLSPQLDEVVQRCLEKDPAARPDSALAVAAALPGSDPLALALAAGVTPAPAWVAAAAARPPLRAAAATGLFSAFAALFVTVAWLAAPSGTSPGLREAKPPDVLAERARQFSQALGLSDDRSGHEAFGFAYGSSTALLQHSQWVQCPGDLQLAGESDAGQPKFWYRRSLAPMPPQSSLNITFGPARTSLTDPPRSAPGMVTLVLQPDGRLAAFEALPAAPGAESPAQTAPPDWSTLFALAGLELAGFSTAAAPCASRYGAAAHAWARHDAETTSPVQVAAATLENQPVFFAVVQAVPSDRGAWPLVEPERRRATTLTSRFLLLTGAALGAIPLARLNARHGRGDRRGALRLSAFIFCARLAAWVLGADHVSDVYSELLLLLFALLGALFDAALVWLFYMALEPYVRRYWPQTIVTWSRILFGRLRDPLVTRDLLIAALLGVLIAGLFELDRFLPALIDIQARAPVRLARDLDGALGGPDMLAGIIRNLPTATYFGLTLLVLLVLARYLVRRTWLAALLTGIIVAPVAFPLMSHPAVSWLPLGAIVTLAMWAATRYGLLVLIGAAFVTRLLLALPVEFRPGSWAWDASLPVLVTVIGIALYGWLAGRRRGAPAPQAR